ncbi:acyltransferase family protein [Acanthopleuribacter pedis]|uniref:Acyltransferase family protein n=1 Tax=Acanthopleuribacter pedis TaxID=442870 RepID=A0A8J7U529_9BACT|nr:acyltransferase family protein [Acanthopleuribacter pedis]MBO1322098.1 acyltransferase family protein [Acanthopleuribacter pedis]
MCRTTSRLGYLDNLRIFVTILVVAHHAGQAYGPTGGDWPIFEEVRAPWLLPFFATNAAWFMGLFFLLSGYFTPASFDRKGAKAFLKDRFVRLGLPIVLFWSPILGIYEYRAAQTEQSFVTWFVTDYVLGANMEVGHLWFLVHLLFYSLAYAAWRRWRGSATTAGTAAPTTGQLVAYGLALTVVTYLVRIGFPIDRWIWIAGVFPSEVAHLPQYLSLFFIGITAGRNRWFETISARFGLQLFGIAIALVAFVYLYLLVIRNYVSFGFETGGPSWGSFRYSLLEAAICISMCLGLPVFFREALNRQNDFLKQLAAGAYTVYIIHFLILVTIQGLLLRFALSPTTKFAVATLTATALCFLCAHLLRKVPGLTRVL